MSAQTQKRHPRYGRPRNANDLFKDGWNARLRWSTVAAVALHAVLFLWSPRWDLDSSPYGASSDNDGLELISLHDGSFAAAGGVLPVAVVPGDDPEPVAEETDPEEGAGTSDWAFAGTAADLRDQLRRRASLAPTVVEPEAEPENGEETPPAETAEAEDGEGTRIGGGYSLSEYETLTDDELLALERLSALRPELAFLSPSSWILLRNPSEVDAFLTERFRESALSRVQGSVSVAIWVDEKGSVEWAEINRSSGRRDVDESALELFKEVVSFRPARQGGVPVPIAMVFWLTFPW